MPARHQQQQKGKSHVVGQPRRQGVAFEMVDADEGQIVRQGDRLGGADADDDAADQARSGRRRHRRQVGEAEAGLRHGLADQPVEMVEMGAGGDFRHHAAELPVLGDLRQHALGLHLAVGIDQRHGRFVAAGFEPEYDLRH